MLTTRRACAAVAALAAPALLAGCTLTGSVEVHSPNYVEVDLTWTPPPSAALVRTGVEGCLLDSTTVTTLDFTRQVDVDGSSVCRVVGHARLADLQRWFGVAREVDGRAQVEFFPAGRVPDAVAEYELRHFEGLDVTVSFPGQVAEHLGGTVQGNTVRFADIGEFVANRGLAASGPARVAEPPPARRPGWEQAAALGLAGVAAGFLAGWWLGRRASRPVAAPAAPEPPEEWSHD